MPGDRLYENVPFTVLNFACPQGVMGGRVPLRGAFPRGAFPLTQIPVRSCGSKAAAFAVWVLGFTDGGAVWAIVTDENMSTAATTTTE